MGIGHIVAVHHSFVAFNGILGDGVADFHAVCELGHIMKAPCPVILGGDDLGGNFLAVGQQIDGDGLGTDAVLVPAVGPGLAAADIHRVLFIGIGNSHSNGGLHGNHGIATVGIADGQLEAFHLSAGGTLHNGIGSRCQTGDEGGAHSRACHNIHGNGLDDLVVAVLDIEGEGLVIGEGQAFHALDDVQLGIGGAAGAEHHVNTALVAGAVLITGANIGIIPVLNGNAQGHIDLAKGLSHNQLPDLNGEAVGAVLAAHIEAAVNTDLVSAGGIGTVAGGAGILDTVDKNLHSTVVHICRSEAEGDFLIQNSGSQIITGDIDMIDGIFRIVTVGAGIGTGQNFHGILLQLGDPGRQGSLLLLGELGQQRILLLGHGVHICAELLIGLEGHQDLEQLLNGVDLLFLHRLLFFVLSSGLCGIFTGRLLCGDFVASGLLCGNLITGEFLCGDFITGGFLFGTILTGRNLCAFLRSRLFRAFLCGGFCADFRHFPSEDVGAAFCGCLACALCGRCLLSRCCGRFLSCGLHHGFFHHGCGQLRFLLQRDRAGGQHADKHNDAKHHADQPSKLSFHSHYSSPFIEKWLLN